MSHSRVSNLSAGRIALGYAVIAILWIAFSDAVVTCLNLHPALMTFKGVGFVFVTASLLYFTIKRLVRAVQASEAPLCGHARQHWRRGHRHRYSGSSDLPQSGGRALTGWRLAEAVGQPLAEVFRIINEQTRQSIEDPAAKVLRLGTVVGLANHTALLARDGHEVPIDDSAAPIIDHRGAIAGVVLIFRDVTQRRRLEEAEAFRRANERFRALVQNSSDMISLFDAEGTVLYHSPAVERLLGYRPRNWIGRNIFHNPIVHPDDLGGKRAFFDAIRARPGGSVTAEFRLRHADGSWRDIDAVGQNFLDDPGVAGIVTNYRDVTRAQTGRGGHSSGRARVGADVRQRTRPDRHP